MMDLRPKQELSENANSAEKDAAAATISGTASSAELTRRDPLRFVWQIDAESRFTIGPGEFITLVGPQTAGALGRSWAEFAAALRLDPEGQVICALATHDSWSGIQVSWPVDAGTERLSVELSGLPVFDRDRVFRGFRGFGVCRDLAQLAGLARGRLGDRMDVADDEPSEQMLLAEKEEEVLLPVSNTSETKAPSLSPVERGAFRELARRLTERLSKTDIEDELADTQDIPLQADALIANPQSSTAEFSKPAGPVGPPCQAETPSAATSNFIARISHEVRTPLNAIIGFAEGMMEERFGPLGSDGYREYLKDIHASGTELIALIDALLDLAKIEAGQFELAVSSLSINDIVQECVIKVQPQANQKRIIIRSSLAPKLPQVVADARSVRQIVRNLLSNSFKFLDIGGRIIVSTALTDRGEVVLRMRDNGVGMSEKEIAAVIEPFSQFATSTRFGSGNANLALPLTRALAEANGATFRVDSKPGTGTLVEISFPSTCLYAE
jgi:signal transduction histidine kinase